MMPLDIWVIDTSALIEAKKAVPARFQWKLFKRLEELVEGSELVFTKQVVKELNQDRYVDVPEAWSLEVCSKVELAYDPDQRFVQLVMKEAGDVVDVDSENDPADPYVIAQALALMELGYNVCVVTQDLLDHLPVKISMATACQRLDIPFCSLHDFLERIGF